MQQVLRDTTRERQDFQRRTLLLAIITLIAFAVLAARMAWLQVLHHEHFSGLSQDNRVRILPEPPPRGLIYDRNGNILAQNLPAWQIDIVPEQVANLEDTLERLGEIIEISSGDIERMQNQRRRQRPFEAVPIRLHLSQEELARFAVRRHEFPGVEMRANLMRHYPYGALTAHVVGYVGAIDRQDLQRLDSRLYRGTSHIGKGGLEQHYEQMLHGAPGVRRVEVNAQGRVLDTLESQRPRPGRDIHLTLDIELQRAAMDALGEQAGAAVAIDPRTGEVLALASTPTFDPNLLVRGLSREEFRSLQNHPRRPMFNRAIRGQYPPGSTVKPFLGVAQIETGALRDEITCRGRFYLPNYSRAFRDWVEHGHGQVDLHKGIVESCDIYFYKLAVELGIEGIHDTMTRFGFGSVTGIDLNGERAGLMPNAQWKREALGEPWFRGETVIAGIGQGYMLSTPLQLAQATATLAREGRRITPHLLSGVQDMAGEGAMAPVIEELPPVRVSTDDTWRQIAAAMRDVVHGERGTARGQRWGLGYEMAGKTGTSQVFGLAQDEEYDEDELPQHLWDHGLFIAWAPYENPRIAVAVIIEHGGSGSRSAAPVARRILDAWLEDDPA